MLSSGKLAPRYCEAYERSVAAFNRFDTNGDGIINREELARAFVNMDPEHWDEQRVSMLMDVVDTNGDGRIKYEEFVQWLMGDDGDWTVDRHAAQLQGHQIFEKADLVTERRETESRTDLIIFQIDQAGSGKVGIKVDASDGKTLVIKEIRPDGLLAVWNADNNVRQVNRGDRIVDVNDQRGDARKLMAELKKRLLLDITVEPHQAALGYVNEITDAYDVELGEIEVGAFSRVRRAIHKRTKVTYAVKSLHKAKTDKANFELLTDVLKDADHPNVIKLFEVFEDCLDFHLVMELCEGGELLEKVLTEDYFSERQAVVVTSQVLAGVTYLHSHSICHRDLRPEHVLLKAARPLADCVLKIVDFRASRHFSEGTRFRTQVGQVLYMAPEVVKRESYTQAVDVWCCGVILYLVLSGYPPFAGESDRETLELIKVANLCFPDDWNFISAGAKDLVAKLLRSKPEERCTAQQALAHPWIQSADTPGMDFRLHQGQERMRAFCGQGQLKKAALHAIAQRLHDDDVRRLKDMFALLDKNGDKTVTFYELKDGLDKLGMGEKLDDLQRMMEEVDVDGSRRIDYTEFLAATLDRKRYREEKTCWQAFQVFDRDHDGYISKQELMELLDDGDVQAAVPSNSVAQVLQECDVDRDGQISFREFIKMMRRDAPPQLEDV